MNVFVHLQSIDNIDINDALIIFEPDFLDEIKSCERFKGSFSKTTVNYLRSIASEFGIKYDKNFNPYRNIVPSDFQGILFKTNEDVSKIVRQMFLSNYPQIFRSYLESKIRNRPFNCQRIIVVGFDSMLVNDVMNNFNFKQEEINCIEPIIKTDEDILNEMISLDNDSNELKSKKSKKTKI